MSGKRSLNGFLDGRTALVTGAARRIGAAIVQALAGQGAAVVIHYRDSGDEAKALAVELQTRGSKASLVCGDLADPAAAAGLVGEAAREAGRPIDILINNASIFESGSEKWDQHQAVNLRAPYLLAQAFAAQLPIDGPADIINMNDIRAMRPGADYLAYTISKVGLHGLTRSLAQALAPRARVNELALGAVLPPDGPAGDGESTFEYVHTLREAIPMRNFPSVAEVTDSLLFLLGNEAVTGQTIQVDGGEHLV
ncbi:MAG: SDR family oxidoreductase [Gemmatimonadales bacterium]|nr:SDR family oxidoreductase [Gemmatimonadales bacterium]